MLTSLMTFNSGDIGFPFSWGRRCFGIQCCASLYHLLNFLTLHKVVLVLSNNVVWNDTSPLPQHKGSGMGLSLLGFCAHYPLIFWGHFSPHWESFTINSLLLTPGPSNFSSYQTDNGWSPFLFLQSTFPVLSLSLSTASKGSWASHQAIPLRGFPKQSPCSSPKEECGFL